MLTDKKLRAIADAARTAYISADTSDREAPFVAAQLAAQHAGADHDTADFLAFALDWFQSNYGVAVQVDVLLFEYRRAERAGENDPEAWRAGLMASEQVNTINVGR